MKGDAPNSNSKSKPKPKPKPKRQLQILKRRELQWPKEGSLVEVTSDEEGFKGAWYVATLLHLPSSSPSHIPPPSSSDSHKTKSKVLHQHCRQAYVEYHSLLAQEGSSKPLREYVNVEFVRPLPPREKFPEPFQLGDVVDTYFRDGWWTGVITGIILEGLRFVVTFQNPPDEIDFGLSELRFHRKWVNRKWVRPAKQKTAGLMFNAGKRVEVSFDREDRCDAWFPATILEDTGNGSYLVEYEIPSKGGDAERVKATVDSSHLRPCPPRLKDNVFGLLEKVDASFDFGWWNGVITKVLADSRYSVYFKYINKEEQFNHTQLRPHMEWKNGNWFTSSQDIMKPLDYQKHEGHVGINVDDTEITVPPSNSGFKENNSKEKTTLSLNLNEVEQSHCVGESPRVTTSLKDKTWDSVSTVTLSPTVNVMSTNTIVSVDKEKVYEFSRPSSETMEHSVSNQSLGGDPSDSHTWGKRLKRKRKKIYEDDTPGSGRTGGSLKKLQVKSPSNSVGGFQEDPIIMQTSLPVVLGLECEKGSNSIAQKPCHSSGEELLRHLGDQDELNDKEPPRIKVKLLLNKTGPHAQDDDKLASPDNLKKRRGRPRKVETKSSLTSPSEDSTKDAFADELLVKDFMTSDDSLKDVEIKSANIDFSLPSQEFVISGSGKKPILEQEKHKNKNNTVSLSQLRKLSETAVEVPIKQQVRRSSRRGRKRTVNVNIVSQVQESPPASTGKMAELSSTAKEVEIVSEELPAKAFEDQPLSKWFQGMHSPAVNASSKVSPTRNVERSPVASNGRLQIVEESTAVDKSEIVGNELQILPFVKNTLLWSTLESMEVFRKLPQKPHFRPLEQYKESSREGLAIGYMVNFSSMVERISKLQFDEPKSTIDDIMETLLELEEHGFNVQVVRDRITDLLTMKEKQEKLQEQFEQLNGEIDRHNLEKVKIDEEMDEINKQIMALQEKLSQAMSDKESKDLEIASLQSKMEGIKEGLRSVERDFQRSAASIV